MDSKNSVKVVVAGTGNVASHLARALAAAPGIEMAGIASRTPSHGGELAARCGCESLTPADLPAIEADLLIVSIPDGALEDFCKTVGPLPLIRGAVHTSGTLPAAALSPLCPATGVLYPLQTFTKGTAVEMAGVPFFVETSDVKLKETLQLITKALGAGCRIVDQSQRRSLHIAGVFTNNFVNILLAKTAGILSSEGLSLEAVRPLAEATIAKAFAIGPHAAQTGPARRGDRAVMQSQEDALPQNLKPIYHLLSETIYHDYHPDVQN